MAPKNRVTDLQLAQRLRWATGGQKFVHGVLTIHLLINALLWGCIRSICAQVDVLLSITAHAFP
jgi:hypothetical protein